MDPRYLALLDRVERPARYLGGEVNAVVKPRAELRVALCFPDLYDLGMSHLGLKILYEILNREAGVAAERCFAPAPDLRELLRAEGVLLPTLETKTPLRECHLVGFSLQYEMCATTLLEMLHLGGIPIRAAARGEADPLVCAGGPCAFNPEPLAPFVDFFLLGDGEEAVVEIAHRVRDGRRRGRDRAALLRELAAIRGVYVPALYAPEYDPEGRLVATRPLDPAAPERVTKALVTRLDRAPYPTAPVVPHVQTTHDRISIEISRGCTEGCRFCQAGYLYRPVRERSPERILELVDRSVAATGYEEVSLSSLSTGDYACLPGLVQALAARPEPLAVAMPSLKAGSLSPEVIAAVGRTGKSGYTIAPEAGSPRLRRVVNKGITDEQVLETVASVFRAGWDSLKLYFMIGLPTETEADHEAIADLAHRCLEVARREGRRVRQITVSCSTFVPKAHTPFQWCRQISVAETEAIHRRMKRLLRHRKLHFRWHDPRVSWLEGILSRGDRRVAAAIEAAWRRGCYLDGWGDYLRLEAWEQALAESGVEPEAYLRERSLEEPLPWDHIDPMIPKRYLLKEWRRALAEAQVGDCRVDKCSACGVCDFKTVVNELHTEFAPPPPRPRPPAPAEAPFWRYRVGFRRTGPARFLSHLEQGAALVRALRRAGLPLRHTQGFNPRPKVAFGPALPVGSEGRAELFEVELTRPLAPEAIAERLAPALPEGLELTGVAPLAAGAPSLSEAVGLAVYEVHLPEPLAAVAAQLPERLARCDRLVVRRRRKGKVKEVDLRPLVVGLTAAGARLTLTLRHDARGATRPAELLAALLGEAYPGDAALRVVRTALLRPDGTPLAAEPLPVAS